MKNDLELLRVLEKTRAECLCERAALRQFIAGDDKLSRIISVVISHCTDVIRTADLSIAAVRDQIKESKL